jgi:hypothetical protein
VAFPNPNKYSQNTQNLSRYPNNKLEVRSIMCNKNGETHPLSKFPPSEWEVRWKHKSVVVEGIAICSERETSFLPMVFSARQSKAKQRYVCMREEDWDSIEIWGWWTINVHTHSKNKAQEQLQWWTIWFFTSNSHRQNHDEPWRVLSGIWEWTKNV